MAKNPSNSSDAPPSKTAVPLGGGRAGLGAALGGLASDPFRLILVLAINVSLVAGIVGTAVILRNRKPPPKPITLAMALGALDRGNAAEAQRMAEHLAASKDLTTEDWGGPDYILGTLTANAAEKASGQERTETFRLASLYLTRSRERGFPEHREAAGLLLLGKCLCCCDRSEDALPVIEQAMRETPAPPAELRYLLIQARMDVQSPDFDKALSESSELLSVKTLTDSQRRRALIQQAQILIAMDRTMQCAETLDKIPDNPLLRYDVTLLRGRLALAEGRALKKAAESSGASPEPAAESAAKVPAKATAKFRAAIEYLRKAQSQDLGDNRIARQASYLMGLCLKEEGDLGSALSQMERTEHFYPGTPEHLAALFQQGEIARQMGRHAEAVSAYQRLMSAYSRIDEFQNPWINLADMKESLQKVCDQYWKAEKYETAVALSKSLAHVLPKAEALQLTAQIYRSWGDKLLEETEHLPPDKATAVGKQARAQLRLAGESYAAVAREHYATRDYPDQLWYSASAYLAGHDFRRAAETLRLYLRNEARSRHAQALVDLGEAQLSLGQTQDAMKLFQECIQQHPRDVAIYRARLLASRAALNLDDLKQAEGFLQDNLNGDQTPASREWRDSLFALAELLHNASRDREAIARLDEALLRYPDAPQAIVTRYLLADSSRRLALDLRASLSKEISSAVRNERANESRSLLKRALDAYSFLQDNLSRRGSESVGPQEQAILRNSRFALGDTYFELDRCREALRAYQSAANHYAASPEVLDAYLQIANVYRRMDRPAEARTSLEQARLALRRLPPEARFEQTTNYNRKQWGDLLDSLCKL